MVQTIDLSTLGTLKSGVRAAANAGAACDASLSLSCPEGTYVDTSKRCVGDPCTEADDVGSCCTGAPRLWLRVRRGWVSARR